MKKKEAFGIYKELMKAKKLKLMPTDQIEREKERLSVESGINFFKIKKK